MVRRPDKWSSMLFGVKDELQTDPISNKVTIENSKEEKGQRITFDNKLDLYTHFTSIIKKANIKPNAFTSTKIYDSRAKDRNIIFYKVSFQLLSSNLDVLFKEIMSPTLLNF